MPKAYSGWVAVAAAVGQRPPLALGETPNPATCEHPTTELSRMGTWHLYPFFIEENIGLIMCPSAGARFATRTSTASLTLLCCG